MSNDKLKGKDKTYTLDLKDLLHTGVRPGALSCTEHMFVQI